MPPVEVPSDQQRSQHLSQREDLRRPRVSGHECVCGKRYKWLDSLRRHQRVECGNKAKRFSCNFCDKKYKYRYEMKNHIVTHHRSEEAAGLTENFN